MSTYINVVDGGDDLLSKVKGSAAGWPLCVA